MAKAHISLCRFSDFYIFRRCLWLPMAKSLQFHYCGESVGKLVKLSKSFSIPMLFLSPLVLILLLPFSPGDLGQFVRGVGPIVLET